MNCSVYGDKKWVIFPTNKSTLPWLGTQRPASAHKSYLCCTRTQKRAHQHARCKRAQYAVVRACAHWLFFREFVGETKNTKLLSGLRNQVGNTHTFFGRGWYLNGHVQKNGRHGFDFENKLIFKSSTWKKSLSRKWHMEMLTKEVCESNFAKCKLSLNRFAKFRNISWPPYRWQEKEGDGGGIIR